jgi:hypothetical protein
MQPAVDAEFEKLPVVAVPSAQQQEQSRCVIAIWRIQQCLENRTQSYALRPDRNLFLEHPPSGPEWALWRRRLDPIQLTDELPFARRTEVPIEEFCCDGITRLHSWIQLKQVIEGQSVGKIRDCSTKR